MIVNNHEIVEIMRIGKITENALKRSVLKPLKTEFKNKISAAVGTDCAFSEEEKTFSTICPYTEDIKDVGYYAVIKACNGLFSQGIEPDQVNVSVLLPEEAGEQELKRIVNDAILGAKACDVVYTGGHTEVTTAVNRPVVTATSVGTKAGNNIFLRKGKPGDALVISKWIALEGTAVLANEKFEELSQKYPVPFVEDARSFKEYMSIKTEMDVAIAVGISAAHDLSFGGVFAGLWEMASRAGCGLRADLKAIPIRQETVEICDFLEVNPYQLLSGGAVLFATDNPEKLVSELKSNDIPAAVVGELTEGNDRIITNLDEVRFLELPQADEIIKVLS